MENAGGKGLWNLQPNRDSRHRQRNLSRCGGIRRPQGGEADLEGVGQPAAGVRDQEKGKALQTRLKAEVFPESDSTLVLPLATHNLTSCSSFSFAE